MKYSIIFFLVFLLSLPALAGERIKLPEVQNVKIDGQEMKCFNVEQYKTVILIASEYKGLFEWKEKTIDTLKLYELQIKGYENTILHYESIMDVQEADRNYLSDRVEALIKEKKSLEFNSNIEKYILYAVNLALAAGLITVSLQ